MSGAIPITGPQTDRARIAPVPDWVVHDPYDSPTMPEEIFVAGGRCMLLDDTQVDLVGPQRSWHGRYVERVMTNSGAERAAQFSVPFDPICETVEIHFVRVRRGDKVIDHAKPEAFEVFRRERSLERLVFDGRLTVHLVIPDVRPGDVVETSYTIIGGNPILRGKHAAWIAFEWGQAMMETRHRLRTRVDRPIHFRGVNGAPAPEVIEKDGVIDRRWRAVRRPAVETEDLAPPWEISRAEIQFSEFDSWSEVADLFTPLYETDSDLPADLQEAVDIIAQGSATPADRAAEVLRFVQRSLRYLSLSIAEGGLQPRPIETAWISRYGDCKDAARLYTAIARRVGLDACPALVNTRQGEGLNEWLPTASAFDHCIVRVIVDGKTHWLDPTRRNQEGGLEHIYKAYYGWALPLAPGVNALSFMGPVRPDHTVDVKERVVFGPKPSSPATYEWRTTYSSWRADDLRERIANEGLSAVAKTYLRQLQDVWPGLVALEPMRFEDDPESNRLTTIERYEIPAPWKRVEGGRVEFATKDYFISADLSDLSANGARKRDVHLGRPREATRTVELELPVNWPSEGWNVAVEAPGAIYETALQRDRKKKRLFTLTQRLRVERDTMPAADAPRYVELVAAMRKGSDVVITSATAGDAFAQGRPRANWVDALRLIFIVAVVLVAVVRILGSN
jgi:transglutaminase-like putative cysteine protease